MKINGVKKKLKKDQIVLDYNNLKKYKDNNLRYKLSDYSNNILLSNTFNIAHIDLFHSINKNNKEINQLGK